MENKTFSLIVSLEKKESAVLSGIVQFDTGNLVKLSLIQDGDTVKLTGIGVVQITIAKPDGNEVVDSTGVRLQAVDPENGLLSFVLDGQCTTCAGLHYCTVSLYGTEGAKITTARFAYYVAESLEGSGAASESDYPILQNLIVKNLAIEAAEAGRVAAEQAREAAEALRADETAGIVTQARELMEQAKAYAADAKNYADACHDIAGGTFITPAELAEQCYNKAEIMENHYTKTQADEKYVYDIPFATIR